MKLFDAHCHLPAAAKAMADTPEDGIDLMLERAAAAGVEGMAVCLDFFQPLEKSTELFPTLGKEKGAATQLVPMIGKIDGCRPSLLPMIGIHPWFVGCGAGAETPPESAIMDRGYNWKESFQTLEKMVRKVPDIGIGETGLDFQDKFENRAEQEECFAAHLELARELDRPVAVHCVQAWGKMLEILREYPQSKIILHAYSGAAELIPELMKLNAWFSFGPAVLNPNAKKARAAVAAVPDERLLVETDSDGEPEKLMPVARAVAELRGLPIDDLAELTFANAQSLFCRPKKSSAMITS